MSARPLRLHASAVVVGEAGILIRGPSGDDRTEIVARHGRLLARPVPPLEGLVERRGLGLTPEPHLASAVIRLVVDCGAEPERMPEPETLVETLAGITLPRLSLRPHPGDERLLLAALALFASPG
jgi:HPr kinase/phosphorylase